MLVDSQQYIFFKHVNRVPDTSCWKAFLLDWEYGFKFESVVFGLIFIFVVLFVDFALALLSFLIFFEGDYFVLSHFHVLGN